MTTAPQFSLWKSIKLRHKLSLMAVAFILLLAGLIGFNVVANGNQKVGADRTSLANRQTMLAQKYVADVLSAGLATGADPAATLDALKDTLNALTNGGSAVINADTGERAVVPAAASPDLRSKLVEQALLVREMEGEAQRLQAVAAADPKRAEMIKGLLATQARLVKDSEQVVTIYDHQAQRDIEIVAWLQIIVGILAALTSISLSLMISRQIADPLQACAEAAHQIAQGNLRIEPQKVTSGDELGQLLASFNDMLFGLRDIATQTRAVCDNLTMAAAQILTSTQEQAAGTKEQAAAVQEITSTVEEISLSGKQVAERARQVAGSAEAVSASGAAGLQAVSDASAGMEAIREQAETVAENIITLSERTQAVGEIIATVNDIAEQSNLVALNAAIEAADAREQGRRFSVVANEIKNLADQAKGATAQVRGILEQTQKGINTSVMLTEEALKRVEIGRDRTSISEQAIRQMAGNIQESVHAFQQIVGATNQQQIGLEQVTQALHEIRHASQQTATTTAQLEKASLELTHLGAQLSKTLEKYRL